MNPLTPKQQEIYEYILAFLGEHGYSPSVREIADAVDLKSPSTVHFHLKGLRAAGLISQAEGKTRTIAVNPDPVAVCHKDQIPVVGSVAAGTPIWADQYIEDYLTFETNGATEDHFALRVRGDSMLYAGILSGDLVVVHRQQNAYEGDIVVALFEDEATVKTYSIQNGHVWLLPENDAYDPIDGTNCTIIGKVIAVIRRYA